MAGDQEGSAARNARRIARWRQLATVCTSLSDHEAVHAGKRLPPAANLVRTSSVRSHHLSCLGFRGFRGWGLG